MRRSLARIGQAEAWRMCPCWKASLSLVQSCSGSRTKASPSTSSIGRLLSASKQNFEDSILLAAERFPSAPSQNVRLSETLICSGCRALPIFRSYSTEHRKRCRIHLREASVTNDFSQFLLHARVWSTDKDRAYPSASYTLRQSYPSAGRRWAEVSMLKTCLPMFVRKLRGHLTFGRVENSLILIAALEWLASAQRLWKKCERRLRLEKFSVICVALWCNALLRNSPLMQRARYGPTSKRWQ